MSLLMRADGLESEGGLRLWLAWRRYVRGGDGSYVTTEYPADAGHGMLLVQLHGENAGQPWAPDAARGMLRRAGTRAGLGKIIPHAFRHGFATAALDASGGNLVITRDAGGWASATVVGETYAHANVHDPAFDAALRRVWGQER